MLYRFSLYGFLKNQRYFEPFLVLFFLEKGLDFLQIGLLVAFRELVINLLEILSGAVADLWGRRRAMILSFSSCMVSFAVFALADSLGLLFFAMFLFGTGESFRTGTHKAMIFSWLRAQGRTAERTLIYGTTRSWSKIGSAVSVILAAVFVLASDNYAIVFWLAMIPYTMGIINFLTYPKELDGTRKSGFSPRVVLAHLRQSLSAAWRQRPIRRLVFESMGFEGVFRAAKDYLQPVIQAAALSTGSLLALGTTMGERQRVALLVGPIYFVLYMLSALASRRAYRPL